MIIKSPQEFNGTLDELYDRYASQLLLTLEAVEEFHQNFQAYYQNDPAPLYLIRTVSGLERGQTIRTEDGSRLRGTDNSPAWWIHYQCFTGKYQEFPDFTDLLGKVPYHVNLFRRLRLPEHVNQAGWHVAHIFEAKNGNTDYKYWDRNELLRRTARNLHPCNYFYIPKAGWRTHGGDPKVIAFFYNKFKAIYQPIWNDFLKLVDGQPRDEGTTDFSNIPYRTPLNETSLRKITLLNSSGTEDGANQICKVTYNHKRLCFKADLIEPLAIDDYFRIITGEGTFEMSKRDFYEVFANVVASQSYQIKRSYHSKNAPQKAFRFKVA